MIGIDSSIHIILCRLGKRQPEYFSLEPKILAAKTIVPLLFKIASYNMPLHYSLNRHIT
jgi:hypothetical protein